ncbi:MAG: membrane protein [bacterium]|nr:MAG: membrane protein [bacterium]
MKKYIQKMSGGRKSTFTTNILDVWWSFIGSAIGIGLCAFISGYYLKALDLTFIIGSFGASAVLIYAAINSPLAQPRNLVGGHIISAIIGVLCFTLFGNTLLAASLAVSLAIAAMLITGTVHPPGGATALIAVIGSPTVHKLGFMYPVIPVGLGAIVLLLVALIVNNLSSARKYPLHWF